MLSDKGCCHRTGSAPGQNTYAYLKQIRNGIKQNDAPDENAAEPSLINPEAIEKPALGPGAGTAREMAGANRHGPG